MHDCPNCEMACDCDMEDHYQLAPARCMCDCNDEDWLEDDDENIYDE